MSLFLMGPTSCRISFRYCPNTWMKHYHLAHIEDDDVDATFDDIPVPELITPLASSSHAAPPFSKVNTHIEDDDVDAAFDDILVLEPVAPLASSSHAAQPFSKVNSAIFDAFVP
ncbi:hypothetical protein J1N35_043680 [Gossypium stocksii]|uniref:Uncharacterized protein n=1 Tax=Gossypium stocksii TaxID=47602 RepID=A0A9D3ZFA8_9ROSI|nr:hypothetical protein J1N35_043680 [Gossypium stocksii]